MPFASAIDSPELVGPEELVYFLSECLEMTGSDTSAGGREGKLEARTCSPTRGSKEGIRRLRTAVGRRMA